MENDKKKLIEGFLLGMLAVLIVLVGWYGFSVGREMKKTAEVAPNPELALKDSKVTSVSEQKLSASLAVEPFVDSEYIIKKGDVQWIDPKDVGDLGLTTKENYSGRVKYVKVGNVVQGNYAGSEVIVIASRLSEGPQASPDFMRMLVQGNNERFILLTQHINNFDEYLEGYIKDNFFTKASQTFYGKNVSIEELDYPSELKGRNERENFVLDQYATGFFTPEKLKPAFVDSKWGQISMTDIAKADGQEATPFELNSYINSYDNIKYYEDIFDRGGFYLHLPDGTAVAYKLVLDIFKDTDRFSKLQATWNDGKKNDVKYEEYPSGCGAGKYVYNKTLEINISADTVAIGKTQKGDIIYGYKDTTFAALQKLYDETYWVGEGKIKKDIAGYLKMNPVVFWVDPFDRTLAFYREDLISPAECGKPVIYLYPEKPMNVSVQVKPGNGLSYTDPAYNNGWNVFADTKSNLKNLSDGKMYPYLFWEGSGGVYYEQPKQGFMVAKDNLDAFFNEKLAQLGLIEKEAQDFKEYWIPEMSNLDKPYYFVTFLSKRYIDQLAPLTINPKPDTVIRVLMDYKGLDNQEMTQDFPIVTPERKGFTVVEWGGFLK